MSITVSIKTPVNTTEYSIDIDAGSSSRSGEWARRFAKSASVKLAVISNRKIFALYGEQAVKSLSTAGFVVSVCLIGDGERFKTFRSLDKVIGFLSENRFTRSDIVLALGGGVVGDLAGFAASVYLRGVTFLQVPTTLLAMIDSSVGGKTAVNTAYGKNLIGTFYQPAGVLIDSMMLETLPRREVTAGLCEAVKQASLDGKSELEILNRFLTDHPVESFKTHFRDPDFIGRLDRMIESQVLFKAGIVRGDEREDNAKSDSSSRKILNFGHTLAHALEKATDYRLLRHGEAVGYGILFAAEVSKKLELLPADEVELLNDVVHRSGKLPSIAHLDPLKVFDAVSYDKKNVNGSVQWILLQGLGKPVIVPQKAIPRSILTASLSSLLK